jgi:hypothetical protein
MHGLVEIPNARRQRRCRSDRKRDRQILVCQQWHCLQRCAHRRPNSKCPTAFAAVDMFMVTTATFKLLYAVIVPSHHRRRGIHFCESAIADKVIRNDTLGPW